MSKINPIALELKSPKFRMRVVKNKKRYNRKRDKRGNDGL